MTIAAIAAVLGLATVLVALYRDRTLVEAERPVVLGWDPLPTVADVSRTEFPLAVPGYQPVAVDTALEALAQAYGDLLAEAPPDARVRAWRRAAMRLGEEPGAVPAHLAAAGTPERAHGHELADEVEDPLEALRSAAALASLDRRARVAARRRRQERDQDVDGDGDGAGFPTAATRTARGSDQDVDGDGDGAGAEG